MSSFFLHCVFWWIFHSLFRSELDDQQIQTLFQQLLERLIHYTSINSKQIAIKLTIAVRRRDSTKYSFSFVSVSSSNSSHDPREMERRSNSHYKSLHPFTESKLNWSCWWFVLSLCHEIIIFANFSSQRKDISWCWIFWRSFPKKYVDFFQKKNSSKIGF